MREKQIDLPTLTRPTNPASLAHRIMAEHPEFQPRHAAKLESALGQILEMPTVDYSQFQLQRVHTEHVMPLIDCAFNKMGNLFVTSSHDRTAQIWEAESGRNLQKFVGHENAVYSCCFNLPYGNLVGTGSFDHRAAIWGVSSGKCLHMMSGTRGSLFRCASIRFRSSLRRARWTTPRASGMSSAARF
jgi:dynein assembly factor with WDR repeat domains 1